MALTTTIPAPRTVGDDTRPARCTECGAITADCELAPPFAPDCGGTEDDGADVLWCGPCHVTHSENCTVCRCEGYEYGDGIDW